MGRSKWKFIFLNKQTWRILFKLKKIDKAKKKFKDFRFSKLLEKTTHFSRSNTILSIHYLRNIFIFKAGSKIIVRPKHLFVRYKFGEFVLTRKFYYYPQKERKKKR